jgi:hypothetical protein
MKGNGRIAVTFLGVRMGTERTSLLGVITTSRSFITQGLWRISTEDVCSFQAAIIQEHFHRFFRGRDSMKGNRENRRSCFWRIPAAPAALNQEQAMPPSIVGRFSTAPG